MKLFGGQKKLINYRLCGNVPKKIFAALQATSHCWETTGTPLPIAHKNLTVRRTLSVTRTVQEDGLVVRVPPVIEKMS